MQQLFRRAVVWAFERFYHEGAWTYDAVAWLVSRGYWRDWIGAVLPDVRDVPLLELGCGTGYLQRERTSSPHRTVGLDESLPMLRLARRKITGVGGSLRLVRGVAQRLPFADQSWLVVVATFPAPYLFDPITLGEIKRVLAVDGRLLIVDAGIVPPGLHQKLIACMYRIVLGQREIVARDIQPDLLDPRIERLEQAGFAVQTEWRTVRKGAVQIVIARVK